MIFSETRHVVVDWERASDLHHATNALAAEVGHRSGAYLVADHRLLLSSHQTLDLTDVATNEGVLYIGSATHLQARLRTLVRALSGHVAAHGFGRTYSMMEARAPIDALALVVVGFDPGYCLEDWLLTQHLQMRRRWPPGNSRPARKTSRHGPRPWVKVVPEMIISRRVLWGNRMS